jgi:hypothetical protein
MSTIINATEISGGGGGGGAPVGAGYLVTAGHADLTAEVVVGTTPGGELGGTWASPTVDATHSGSSHAGVQAAAEATAAAALSAHESDTTSVHGITDTSTLYRSGGTDVAVADGGTGASDASGARTNLGLVIGTDVQAYSAALGGIAGLSPSNDDVLQRKAGAWANRSMAQLLADLAAVGTTFQPLDADLTSIAALTTTAYGRSLLEAANAAAIRTLSGLVIGTDVQAFHANLAAIAGLTSAADRLPYFAGSGTAALATFTSAARDLLDDADAAAMLATLGAVALLPSASQAIVAQGAAVTPLILRGHASQSAALLSVQDSASTTLFSVGAGGGLSSHATANSGFTRWSSTGHLSVAFQRVKSDVIGVHAAVASGDIIGGFTYRGSDGTAVRDIGYILGTVDGTVSSGIVPGRFDFYTTDAAGSTPVRMRIDSAGLVTVYYNQRTEGYVEIKEQSAPATPSSGYGRHYTDTSGDPRFVNDAGVDRALVGATEEAFLTANVTLTTAGTTYDGPAITLGPGTWMVVAQATIANGSNNTARKATAHLYDGSAYINEHDGCSVAISGAQTAFPVPLSAIVTVASGTKTITLRVTPDTGGMVLRANPLNRSLATNKSTSIRAVRVA